MSNLLRKRRVKIHKDFYSETHNKLFSLWRHLRKKNVGKRENSTLCTHILPPPLIIWYFFVLPVHNISLFHATVSWRFPRDVSLVLLSFEWLCEYFRLFMNRLTTYGKLKREGNVELWNKLSLPSVCYRWMVHSYEV